MTESNWTGPRSTGDSITTGYSKVMYFAHLIYHSLHRKHNSSTILWYIESKSSGLNRGHHRNIALEGADLHSHMFAAEEHLGHSHMTEFDHDHMQVAGVGKYSAEDTVLPE